MKEKQQVLLCDECHNQVTTAAHPDAKGIRTEDGRILCAACAYKILRANALSIPAIRERVNANRNRAIKSAKEKKLDCSCCPADCVMRTGLGTEALGCRAVSRMYDDGECPFYRPGPEERTDGDS